MEGIPARDPGVQIDWGRTSADYGRYRPGYPESFWTRLAALGVGRSGERVVDLGTGTGVLARRFAARGAKVVGVDVSIPQIEEARRLAAAESLDVEFRVASAEETGLPDRSSDLVTASQSWLYFDKPRVIPEVKRLLAPGGRLLTCHFSWLPRLDTVARQTEKLVLAHNPRWTAADWAGVVPAVPGWAAGEFELCAMFWYDEAIPFTRAAWRGRIRACRGVGAALSPEAVERFDRELEEILTRIAPAQFDVLHRIDAHLWVPSQG